MANVPSLSENTAPDGTDVLYLTDGTNDEKVQVANLLKGSGAEVPAAKITGTVAHENGGLEADVSAYDGLVQISGGSTSAIKNNWAASAAPTTGDDSGDGYVVGSRWIDTTNDKEYVCLDNSSGAAVWTETTGGGGGGAIFVDFDTNSGTVTTNFAYATNISIYFTATGTSAYAVGDFVLPSGFTSIDAATLYMTYVDHAKADPTLQLLCGLRADGEHFDSGGTINSATNSSWYAHSSNDLVETIDVTSLFSGAAAGDLGTFGVSASSMPDWYRVLGLVIEYS